MNLIILERQFDPPIDRACFDDMARAGADCLPIYRVNWVQSLLARDGRRLVCQFEAPDCETVRINARASHPKKLTAWQGKFHCARTMLASAVVERSFDQPANLDALQQQEEAHQWCLDTYQVTFVGTFLSTDKKRMLCLYQAPDAECVRAAQHQAGMPFDRVWACHHLNPVNCPANPGPSSNTSDPGRE